MRVCFALGKNFGHCARDQRPAGEGAAEELAAKPRVAQGRRRRGACRVVSRRFDVLATLFFSSFFFAAVVSALRAVL